MLRLALPLVLTNAIAAPALAQSTVTPRAPTMLIHGNYCGPGNNAPLPPIDALDRACARHDACTPDGSLPTPACNARLERDARAIERDPHQPEALRSMAGMVAAGASMMASAPGETKSRRFAAQPSGGSTIPAAYRPRVAPAVSRDE